MSTFALAWRHTHVQSPLALSLPYDQILKAAAEPIFGSDEIIDARADQTAYGARVNAERFGDTSMTYDASVGGDERHEVASQRLVEQVLADYDLLEPDETDSWSPISSKYQLGYRLNLYYCLTKAMRRIESSMPDLRIADLGCGTGRSTRMYLDVGLRPEQVTGLDFRPATIARARKFNPALSWQVYDGGALPTGFNFVATATVFSSISTPESREVVVARIRDGLPTGGFVFYYDLRKANDFAGGDPINPEALFGDFEILWKERLGRFSTLPLSERLRGLMLRGPKGDARTPSLRELIGDVIAPSQEAYLLRKL